MSSIPNVNFNQEELLFLNRIGFLSYVRHGSALNFNQFIDILTEFQYGSLDKLADMVIEIMKEGRADQNVIQIDLFVNFILASIPQDTQHETNAQEVFADFFKDYEYLISIKDLK